MGLDSDEDDAKQMAFLRARIVEATREGDIPEIKYLVGISAAARLLTASDEVRLRMYEGRQQELFCELKQASDEVSRIFRY